MEEKDLFYSENQLSFADTNAPKIEAHQEDNEKLILNPEKHVHFAVGTAGPREGVLAVSISGFDYVTKGYLEYSIQVCLSSSIDIKMTSLN